MDIEIHDFSFSVDQPETLLRPLLVLLRSGERQRNQTETSRTTYQLEAQGILIIDVDRERANAIAQFIDTAGYRSVVAETALEAFTLFLKGTYIPQVVFLGQGTPANHLFLQRLLQQTLQIYGKKVPLIRLHVIPSVPPEQPVLRVPTRPLQQLSPQEQPISMSGIEQIEREKISLEGLHIGRYHIGSLIGAGLQGSVYQTYDRLREDEVALKAVRVSTIPYAVARVADEEENLFQQESDLLGMLDHTHIQSPLSVGRSYVSGSPFVYKTMPYYPERSLLHWLTYSNKQRSFSAREVIHIALQLADALQYVHKHQILYQNFKLTNLLIREPSNDMRGLHLILSDFAIVQDGSSFSRTPEAFAYMAPERWLGRVSPASDQYGLAAILYELLTGRPPFQGASEYAMRLLHTSMQPQPLSAFNAELTPAIDHVVLRALAKRPEHRFPDVESFAKTLQRYC